MEIKTISYKEALHQFLSLFDCCSVHKVLPDWFPVQEFEPDMQICKFLVINQEIFFNKEYRGRIFAVMEDEENVTMVKYPYMIVTFRDFLEHGLDPN